MKTYKLLKDIENPQHDKRCSYGHKKYETFKAGTFFEGMSANLDNDRDFSPAYIQCYEWRHLSGDTAVLIIGNSVEAEPKNWHEIATIGGGYHHFSSDVIEQLLKVGAVSLDKVKNALAACLYANGDEA